MPSEQMSLPLIDEPPLSDTIEQPENYPVIFNLIDEPWLPVRFPDGDAGEVGLRDALVRAHEIAGLDVDYPTQEPALLRLLLAVCYRALQGPADDQAWRALWTAGKLPSAALDAYLERWRSRFDLFHPDTPFFQSPGLEASGKDGSKPANKLIAYAPSGNNVPIFTPITDSTSLRLSPAEAARWLIERHAWGTTADKTGAKGNHRVKAGTYTPQIGHLGWIGFVAPIGDTLFKTLALNLVPWSRTTLVTVGPEDLPAWERPPTDARRTERPPDGTCDLFTWQGRRIRLFPESVDGKLTVPRVLICAGDNVQRDAVVSVDPHTGWSHKTKRGTVSVTPTRAHLDQQVWRGLAALLALDDDTKRAGVMSWLAAVADMDIVPRVSLLVSAAEYVSQSAIINDLLVDRLETVISVLREDDLVVATLATDAAGFVEKTARALEHIADARYLKYDKEQRHYIVPEGKRAQAKAARVALAEELFGELDQRFRRFLVELGSAEFVDHARHDWAEMVEAVGSDLCRRRLAQMNAAEAFTGAYAESRFRQALLVARKSFAPSDPKETAA